MHLALPEELELVSLPPRVLLAAVDPDIRWLLVQKFKAAGFMALAASTGAGCLLVAQMCKPDIIVLDVELGCVVDGYQICRELKAGRLTKHIPVILASGEVDLAERAAQAGAGATISKPDEGLRLPECLRRLLKH